MSSYPADAVERDRLGLRRPGLEDQPLDAGFRGGPLELGEDDARQSAALVGSAHVHPLDLGVASPCRRQPPIAAGSSST